MSEHEERADEVEREIDQLQRASDALGGHIDDARDDLHRKQGDPSIPGADHDDHFLADADADESDDED